MRVYPYNHRNKAGYLSQSPVSGRGVGLYSSEAALRLGCEGHSGDDGLLQIVKERSGTKINQ
jgi:hypothetical protein